MLVEIRREKIQRAQLVFRQKNTGYDRLRFVDNVPEKESENGVDDGALAMDAARVSGLVAVMVQRNVFDGLVGFVSFGIRDYIVALAARHVPRKTAKMYINLLFPRLYQPPHQHSSETSPATFSQPSPAIFSQPSTNPEKTILSPKGSRSPCS